MRTCCRRRWTPGCRPWWTRTGCSYLPETLPDHWLLTPHAGELASLLGEERSWVTDDPVRAVRAGGETDRRHRAAQGRDPAGRRPRRRLGARWRCPVRAGPARPGRATRWAGCVPRCWPPGSPARRRGPGRLAAGVHRDPAPGRDPADPAGRAGRRRAGPTAAAGRGPTSGRAEDRWHGTRDRAAGIDPAHGQRGHRPRRVPGQPRRPAGLRRPAELMVVVKADGYGHGMLRLRPRGPGGGRDLAGRGHAGRGAGAARGRRRRAGAGLAVRGRGGPEPRWSPPTSTSPPSRSTSSPGWLAAAATAERRARVHLKIDTGLSRNGAAAGGLARALRRRRPRRSDAGAVEVVGIWSHFAAADEPGHPSVPVQIAAFERGVRGGPGRPGWSRRCAIWPTRPVRCCCRRPGWTWCGSASPRTGSTRRPESPRGRRTPPAGDDAARAAGQRQVDRRRGRGVVRLDLDRARQPTTVGPGPARLRRRHPAARGQPRRGRLGRWPGAGPRPDLHGPVRGRPGRRRQRRAWGRGRAVRLRGHGEPTAADWAEWCGTIGYEIVTRIGARVPRVYRGATGEARCAWRRGRGIGWPGRRAGGRRRPRWPWAGWRWAWSWSGGWSASGSPRSSQAEVEAVLRAPSAGPTVTTADGVVLHTEVDEVTARTTPLEGVGRDRTRPNRPRPHPGLRPRLRPEHGLLALPAPALRGRVRQVFYDQRSHGRSSRSAPERCRLPQLADRPGAGPGRGGRPRAGGPGRALDGRHDDHAAGPGPAGAVRHPDRRRRAAAHLGGGDGRPLTDPRPAGPDLLPGGRTADGLAEPDPRAGRHGAGGPAATSATW